MCGILGGIWQGSRDVTTRLDDALLTLNHRGPDDKGAEVFVHNGATVGLGHTRLSIIDLSSGGHQPMQLDEGLISIVFNGEIYNYKELKAELFSLGYTFKSDSDTEVLITAWKQWGVSCLPRLIGMFAFVIVDKQKGTATCVRDAFGIKPFYYCMENGNFLFGSEIHPIKKLKQEKVTLNWQKAYEYLLYNDYDTGVDSFFAGVYQLLPGHFLEFDIKTSVLSPAVRWWNPSTKQKENLSFNDTVEQVREKFLSSVKLHLRTDVPFGAALSGGIDSSAIVCAIRHVEPDAPIHTFSFIANEKRISEEKWVDMVNEHVNAIPHKLSVDPSDLISDLDDMIRAQGEPFGSTSIYAQYRVFKHARENGITVTLEGQGADEMLAGYIGYPGQRIRSLLEKFQISDAWAFLNGWSSYPGRSRVDCVKRVVNEYATGKFNKFLRQMNGIKTNPSWIRLEPLQENGVNTDFERLKPKPGDKGRRVADELLLSLTQRGIPALLRHGDRNSMRFSIEGRVPFLNTELAGYLLSLPEEFLVSPTGETKHVFRAAMKGIVPDEILERKDKIGFETPEYAWIISMQNIIRDWISVGLDLPFLNQKEIIFEFEQIIQGKKPYSWQVWRWINFIRWYVISFEK